MSKPCESTCPKCGCADVVRDLRPEGSYYDPGYGKPYWIKPPWVKDVHYGTWQFVVECIEHRCRGCHYEWATEPLTPTPTGPGGSNV